LRLVQVADLRRQPITRTLEEVGASEFLLLKSEQHNCFALAAQAGMVACGIVERQEISREITANIRAGIVL
jgi:hypothetical protein